jgi:hypothetical protein
MMENKKYVITIFRLLLCIWTFLLAGNTTAATSLIEKNLPLQLGNYLSVEYINLLKQTRSPITAGKHTDYRQYITIGFSVEYKQIYIRGMGSFHEGLEGLVTDQSLNIVSDKFGDTPAKIKVLSRFEFSIAVGGKDLVYRYVGNLQNYISRHTLAGMFKDSKGGMYSFTEDGLASFPNRTFQYEVDPDYVMSSFDNFYEVLPQGGGTVYGFKFDKNKLELFNMGGPMGEDPETAPFVTLTRIE